jgi:uncharacterized protein (TIGR02246 family)
MSFRALAALAALTLSHAAFAQTAPHTVEQRLQLLEDKQAIGEIIQQYTDRLTARDFDGYVALFTPDGTWRNGPTIKHGRDEIRAMLVGIFPNTPADYVNNSSYMLVSNIEVKVDGDRATAKSRQLSIIRNKDGDPQPVLSGRYEDVFVRYNGEWKIQSRNDITFIPTPDVWRKKMAEGMFQE